MTTCHHTIDSPIGPLTLVAADGELREVRFPNAPPVDDRAGPDDPGRSRPRRRRPPARRVLRRHAARVRPAARPAGHAVPARRLAGPGDDPVRRDGELRRAGPPARPRRQGPGRRRGERPQPAPDRAAVPPRRRQRRQPHRLRRRPGDEGLAAPPRAPGRRRSSWRCSRGGRHRRGRRRGPGPAPDRRRREATVSRHAGHRLVGRPARSASASASPPASCGHRARHPEQQRDVGRFRGRRRALEADAADAQDAAGPRTRRRAPSASWNTWYTATSAPNVPSSATTPRNSAAQRSSRHSWIWASRPGIIDDARTATAWPGSYGAGRLDDEHRLGERGLAGEADRRAAGAVVVADGADGDDAPLRRRECSRPVR